MADVDMLIIGAGSAGATLAWKAAARGLRVRLVDKRRREAAGAWWINGVERRLFEALDLGPPEPPVVFATASAIHLEAPSGRRVTCREVPTVEVHMGHLNDLLLGRAEAAGADLVFERALESPVIANGVVQGARFRGNSSLMVQPAAVTVDASGVDGGLRNMLPGSSWPAEAVSLEDLCVAAQQVRVIDDPLAATAFLESHGLAEGETLSWAGLAGGYSILNVTLDLDAGHVSFLSGAMLHRGSQAAVDLIERGAQRLGFVGGRLFGGAGLIPVRRAFDRLVGPGYALLGTAASQVFPAHGSGVAAGMRAAEILADVLAQALSRGAPDLASLWPYAARYQQGRGAQCAGTEPIRRFSETLTPADLEALLGGRAIDARAVRQSLGCWSVSLSPGQLIGVGRAVVRAPRLAARLLSAAARAKAVEWHYRHYPAEWDPEADAAWRRRRARLLG